MSEKAPNLTEDNDDVQDPEWEVGIRAYGPDDEPGEARWEHYHPRASDEETAEEKAVEMAKRGIDSIIGISDSYEVYQVAGPFDVEDSA
ncbi:hypothetical protein [Halomicrobium urmianum]|uniref:hypothetical protein n=1 Tax=Halomicrobium urmianum TaxID=1586233 RepID=UPI001CD99937|nr:hypothetical protein [Halomicrobium urmianum]